MVPPTRGYLKEMAIHLLHLRDVNTSDLGHNWTNRFFSWPSTKVDTTWSRPIASDYQRVSRDHNYSTMLQRFFSNVSYTFILGKVTHTVPSVRAYGHEGLEHWRYARVKGKGSQQMGEV